MKHNNLFILHTEYHDCWWLGDARNQYIIDLVIPDKSGFSIRRVERKPFKISLQIINKVIVYEQILGGKLC